jgi:predicted RNA-binding Zn ribbon-like protein
VSAVLTEPADRSPAPGSLRLVQSFINSNDREAGHDRFESTEGMVLWASDHVIPGIDAITAADRERTVRLREALRSLAIENVDSSHTDAAAWSLVNHELGRVRIGIELGPEGLQAVPRGSGIDRLVGDVLAALTIAVSGGAWPRLKACRRDTCQWAFYDRSPNRSSAWCAMQICGAREKAKSYYRRRHPTSTPG